MVQAAFSSLMHLLVRSELKSQYVNIENNLLYARLAYICI